MKTRRSIQVLTILLAALAGCSGEEGGHDNPLDGGTAPRCAVPACAVDDGAEPTAAGDWRSWSFNANTSVDAVALSANGRRIAVGDAAGRVHLFGAEGGSAPRWTYQAEDSRAQFKRVAISRDGRRVAATDGLDAVYLFECDDPTPVRVWRSQETTEWFQDVALSHDGCTLAAATPSRVYRFERDDAEAAAVHTPSITRGDQLSTVEIAGDGARIVAGTLTSIESGAELFLYEGGATVATHATDYSSVTSNVVEMPLAISTDGAVVVAGGADRRIHVYDGDLSPRWSFDPGSTESAVWSLALSDDGGALFASAGDSRVYYFGDMSQATPSWSFDGAAQAPHGTGVGIIDPYRGGLSPEGPFDVGAYPGTVSMSADGKYPVFGAWNSGHVFGMYRRYDRPFRVYSTSSESDPVGVVAVSADGAWIAAGTTFGEVLAWEVAPAVMLEVDSDVTVNIPEVPEVTDLLDLDDLVFTRTALKPGRAAHLTERWRLYAIINGVLVPPEASWLVSSGEFKRTHDRQWAAGNLDETTTESMDVPQIWQTPLTVVTGFVLRLTLEDAGTERVTSDEAAPFADVQLGL